MSITEYPCMHIHPRHADWLGRVVQLQKEMTRSDAQGVADMEFRFKKLPRAVDLPPDDKNALVAELKWAIQSVKLDAGNQGRRMNADDREQIRCLNEQIGALNSTNFSDGEKKQADI